MPIEPRYPRRGRTYKPYDHGEPLRWISLVPLAGIFAIAGALIASTYGLTPNAITVDLPAPYPESEVVPLTPPVNRLILREDGAILWNGERVSEAQLGAILDDPRRKAEGPALLFTPEPDVRYQQAVRVLDLLRRHGAIDRCFRFSGIQHYRQFESPDTFDDLTPDQREDCPPLPREHQMPSIIK